MALLINICFLFVCHKHVIVKNMGMQKYRILTRTLCVSYFSRIHVKNKLKTTKSEKKTTWKNFTTAYIILTTCV